MTEEKRGEGYFLLLKTFFFHFSNMRGIFMGYTRGIRGVFMGYTYVSGMCRVCIGYVSGTCRRIRARGIRGGRGEYIYSSDKKY